MADYTFQQLEALVAQAGGSPTQQEYLAGIAAGVESGGNPTAHNPTSTASGLWQELTTTWLGNGGGSYAPTAAQASPLDQAIVAVRQSTGGYQPWAPDLGGAYGASGNAGNPQSPAAGSPVYNYLKKIGATLPTGGAAGVPAGASSAPAGATTTAYPGGALDPLNIPGEIAGAGGSAVASGILGVIQTITDPLVHFLEDSTAVVFGIILFIVAMVIIAHSVGGGGSSSTSSPAAPPQSAPEDRPPPPKPSDAYNAGQARGRAEATAQAHQPQPQSSRNRNGRTTGPGRERIGSPTSGAGGEEADVAAAALA